MSELSCPEARSLVSDYIDGDLPPATAADLEHHLQTCPCCPPMYASLVQTLAELKALDDSVGVEALAQRVVTALAELDDDPAGPGPSS